MTKKVPGAESLKRVVVDAILDKKGQNVVSLDLRKIKDTPSDFFIITHGDSTTQVRALYQNVIECAAKKGFNAYHTEGMQHSEWIIVDFVDVVVHIFYKEKRDFYALEDLWSDAKVVTYNPEYA